MSDVTTTSGPRPAPNPRRSAAAALGLLGAFALLLAFAAHVDFDGATLGPLPVFLATVVLVAFAAVVVEGRRDFFAALGLDQPVPIAAGAGLAMAAPTLVALWIAREPVETALPLHLVRIALATTLTEEIALRGYALLTLTRRAGFRAPTAAALTMLALAAARVATAFGHASARELVEIGLVAAATSGWLAWLVLAWRGNLWVAIALHFGMNLAWSLFEVDTHGGVAPHVGRLASVAASIALTLAARRYVFTSSAAPSDRA
ncbi:MAG TPA: CPBP family glutamic-type intramembrane protease [Byssovorax sp.]|jgi:membrane protease YdiL (CAAX protease family)